MFAHQTTIVQIDRPSGTQVQVPLDNHTSRVMAEFVSTGRKRVVSSCLPCYSRKQKCSRQRPCNHCTRRRRPEQCTYQTHISHNGSMPHRVVECQSEHQHLKTSAHVSIWPVGPRVSRDYHQGSLSDVYGYVENSEVNTLGLLRKVAGFYQEEHPNSNVSHDMAQMICNDMERMPARPILDYLTQFFISEVNWMSQLVHPPSFVSYYESWWTRKPTFNSTDSILNVVDIDFAVLVLSMCALATQFLPSPTHLVDAVRGVPLARIKDVCADVGDSLCATAVSLDPKGSLFRIQHMSFSGLNSACEGRMADSWAMLDRAVGLAQGLGYHREIPSAIHEGIDELELEMQRRAFCNLYIWDGILSRQLDRVPFLSGIISPESLPSMRLMPDVDIKGLGTPGAPEFFTERLLQARLTAFWKRSRPSPGTNKPLHDPLEAEEQYRKFQMEFLDNLPPAFSLHNPSCEWDEQLPFLPMQRQLLRITIFESICHHLRPLLLLGPAQFRELPAYKRVLVGSQTCALAHAALSVLEAASTLHNLLGASHTRSTSVISPTFEASVLLVCLCINETFPGIYDDRHLPPQVTLVHDSILGVDADAGRKQCMQAAQIALTRLQMLAEVSVMAEVGARNLSQLLQQVTLATTASKTTSSDIHQDYTSSASSAISGPSEFTTGMDDTITCGALGRVELVCFDLSQLDSLEDMFPGGDEDFQHLIDHSQSLDVDCEP